MFIYFYLWCNRWAKTCAKLGVCGRSMSESCHPAVDRRGSRPALLQCGAERVDSPNACDSHLIIFSLSSLLGTLEVWPTGHTLSRDGRSSKLKPRTGEMGCFADQAHTSGRSLNPVFASTSSHSLLCLVGFHTTKLHIKNFKHPVSLLLLVWGTLPLPKLQDRVNPLGQTIPFLLTPPRR